VPLDLLAESGVNSRDSDYPATNFFSLLKRLKIAQNMTEAEQYLMIKALARNPRSSLISVPLFNYIWAHWSTNAATLLSRNDGISMSLNTEDNQGLIELIRLKHRNLQYTLEIIHQRLSKGMILFSVLSNDMCVYIVTFPRADLSATEALSLDDFLYKLESVGLKFSVKDSKQFESMLCEAGFLKTGMILTVMHFYLFYIFLDDRVDTDCF